MSDVYLWETYDKLGREALDSGNLEQADQAFRSAVATAEEIGSHDRLVLSLRNLAATLMDMNQVADSHELLVRTLEVATQELGEEHSQTVETQRDLSQVCQQLGYLDRADELLKRVAEQELRLDEKESLSSTLLSLAQLAQSRKQPQEAAAYLRRVVKLKEQLLGDDHPGVAQAQVWLSTALYQCGEAEDARQFMQKAFGMMERHFADEPLHLAQSLMAGAKLMLDAGQHETALMHQKRALDILSDSLGPNHDKIWEARDYIATTLAAQGKVEEAIEIIEFCFRQDDVQGPRAGAAYKNLAGLYLTLDQKEKAEELYTKAATLLETTLGSDHPAYLATLEEQIQLYHFSGRSKEALKLALKTIRPTENRFGAGHPNTAQIYASTAVLAHSAQEWQTALELMRAAEKIWSTLIPRPEDVLDNCRTNIATCLIKLGEFDEAEATLMIAEARAGEKLKPVIAALRSELEAGRQSAAAAPSLEHDPDPSEELGSTSLFDSAEPTPDSVSENSPSTTDESETLSALESPETETSPDPEPEPDFTIEVEPDPISAAEFEVDDVFADFPEPPEPMADPLFADETQDEAPNAEEASELEPAWQEPVLEEPATEERSELEDEPALTEELFESEDEPALTEELFEPEGEPISGQEPSLEEPELEAPAQVIQIEHDELELAADDLFLGIEEEPEVESEAESTDSAPEAESEEAPVDLPEEEQEESPAPLSSLIPKSEPGEFVERRANPRVPLSFNRFFDLKVELENFEAEVDSDGAGSNHLKSYLVDLGPGGIRINSESPFPAEGEMVVTLPEQVLGEEIALRAEVAWQKTLYGASFLQGLVFKDLTPEQETLIDGKLSVENGKGRVNSRQHFRLYRPFPIKVKESADTEWVTSYATDLSINGLGTRLRAPLDKESDVRLRLELEFELPTVEVEARVAWSKSGENGVTHGLQFATVGPVEARTIKRYIDRCLEFLPD